MEACALSQQRAGARGAALEKEPCGFSGVQSSRGVQDGEHGASEEQQEEEQGEIPPHLGANSGNADALRMNGARGYGGFRQLLHLFCPGHSYKRVLQR